MRFWLLGRRQIHFSGLSPSEEIQAPCLILSRVYFLLSRWTKYSKGDTLQKHYNKEGQIEYDGVCGVNTTSVEIEVPIARYRARTEMRKSVASAHHFVYCALFDNLWRFRLDCTWYLFREQATFKGISGRTPSEIKVLCSAVNALFFFVIFILRLMGGK